MQRNIRLCTVTSSINFNHKHPETWSGYTPLLKMSKYLELHHVIMMCHLKPTTLKITKNTFIHTVPYIGVNNLLDHFGLFITQALTSLVILYFVIKNRLNIIKAKDPLITGIPAFLVSIFLKKKFCLGARGFIRKNIVSKIRDNNNWIKAYVNSLGMPISTFLFRKADCIFAVNEEVAHEIRSMGASNIINTGIFLNFSMFKSQPLCKYTYLHDTNRKDGKIRVLYVGRLSKEKGIDFLLEAASKFKGHKTKIEFLIVGNGPDRERLQNISRDYNLSNVHFLGYLSHQKMPKIYSSSDIFILPSLTEGTPVALFEAMASALPIILSSIGSLSFFLKRSGAALIVPTGDPESLVKAIRKLISSPYLRQKLSLEARKLAISHENIYLEKHLQGYIHVLSSKK